MGDRRNGEQAGAAENRRIWVLAIVAVVVLAAGIGGGIMLFGQGSSTVKHDAAPRNKVKTELAEEAPKAEPPSETPRVEPYATGMSGKKITASPQAAAKASPAIVPPNVDGCDHAYGTPGLCVPWNFPAGTTSYRQKCAWLKENHYPEPLSVHGTDRLQLDPDKNKVACDS
jgi:hypothetical protein